jgi:hypothetical protein
VFGKHVHPTGHCAPINVLSGSGNPEAVEGAGLEVSLAITITAAKNKTSEIIKSIMAPASI